MNDPAVMLQQALSLQQDGNLKEAERLYRRVLVADPANPDALNLLAVIHHERGDREMAVRMLRAAVTLSPERGRYWNNLAVVLSKHGDRYGSVAALRMANAQATTDVFCAQALIFAMDLHPYALNETRMADRRAFNARYCAALTAEAPLHLNVPDPDRSLRVGYVSADLRQHSAGMCVEPILANHDPAIVSVTIYSNHPGAGDATTERFKSYAEHWSDVAEMSDEELADQIRDDQIDILVDLSGYSGGNRLMTFARKPAPIQVTAWGHVTGTGLDCMDYLLADPVQVPREHEPMYTERVLHLPSLMAYRPSDGIPDVAPPPAEQNGYVTFGYLGRANKTSEMVWATWAAILHRVPHSRLILKSDDYSDLQTRSIITDFFIGLRISAHRLEFRGATDHLSHLAAYTDVDVALDPFPQCGGVTTIEACLMGVPTVTLLGDFINGRTSASILTTLGQDFGVAKIRSAYVERAVALAGRGQTLGDRLAIRDRLLGSIICDGPAYAAHVEALYHWMWETWCTQQQPASPDGVLALT